MKPNTNMTNRTTGVNRNVDVVALCKAVRGDGLGKAEPSPRTKSAAHMLIAYQL